MTRRTAIRSVLLGIAALTAAPVLASQAAADATVYVSSSSGADGNPGTISAPVATLAEAAAQSQIVSSEPGPAVRALRVGPNPTAGRVYVSGASSPVEVLDQLGRVVTTAPVGRASLDLSRLAPGRYTVRSARESASIILTR